MKTSNFSKTSPRLKKLRAQFHIAVDFMLRFPAIMWVLLGFFWAFYVFFIIPTFLNPYHELRLFSTFPVLKPLGADLHEYLNFSKLLVETGTPYMPPNYYPPLQAVLFIRFMLSGPNQSYIYITTLSFLCFLATVWILPMLHARSTQLKSPAIFALITGLFSYGLWFELERGQFDLLVMALCLTAIYIYHYHPRLHLVAYTLFILSVNIKIYPLIFILCFTTNWLDWKRNLRRWTLLLLANFAGLLILGWKVFLDFVHALADQMNQPTYWWMGNHSINSFVRVVAEKLQDSDPAAYAVYQPSMRSIEMGLFFFYLICLIGVLRKVYRHRLSAANPYLLLILTIGTMLIPSTSHDYKLSILIAPMVLLLNNLELHRSGRTGFDLIALLLIVVVSATYSATLFLHTDLPVLLANNMPILMGLATASTLLFWVRCAQSHRLDSGGAFTDVR